MAVHDIDGRAQAPLFRKPGQEDLRRVAIIAAIYVVVLLAAAALSGETSAPAPTGLEDWHGNVATSSSLG